MCFLFDVNTLFKTALQQNFLPYLKSICEEIPGQEEVDLCLSVCLLEYFSLLVRSPFFLWKFTVSGYQVHPPPSPSNLAIIAEVTGSALVRKACFTGTLPFNGLVPASIKASAASSL